MLHPAALLDSDQSREADRTAIDEGIPGETLMENAGRAVADLICDTYAPCNVLIICGTGNNGGDGFVVARLLKERGWPVLLSLSGSEDTIRGEAGTAKRKWKDQGGRCQPFQAGLLEETALIVDAMFGTGLSHDIEGIAKETVNAINKSKLPVVSIDIPSGVNASDGRILGVGIKATHTVTFVRPKLGHVLLPGKSYTGELHVFDIGIDGGSIAPKYFYNTPALWRDKLPMPGADSHKYTRGHAIILGGGINMTGAARLAAISALRAGAGLSSIACPPDALPVYAASSLAVMTKPIANLKELDALIDDKRVTAICVGPGSGANEKTREQIIRALDTKKACVLDADAISAFTKTTAKTLFNSIKGPTVLTPHEGEFSRIFSGDDIKTIRARQAAKQSGAVIVLKGNDTVIAAPDGRLVINAEAPVWLATAGSGDVLAGLITGLLAQGMPAFEAATAAVWMHSRAAAIFGPGLIAEDLPNTLPTVLKELHSDGR